MYLKQIELENFKSFGGKLTIPLMEGYIAVTGPNGSGKSNISDAILFVLGPRSSKAIRAGKLSDLIFDGGKSKSPSTYTKVSLVFDNQDRLIPWDADTVKLTRLVRLSQNGETYNSYFYVNDNKSSLTEFDNILSSARISADGYNLVQQGDVTRIVEMGNIERRKILENISGISRFDGEIERAQNERRQAEENIDRISIIIDELEKQLQQLEEERRAAMEYIQVRSRLEMAKAQLSHKTLEVTLTEANSIQEQIEAYDQDIHRLLEEKRQAHQEMEVFQQEVQALEGEIELKGGQEYRDLKEEMNSVRVELARHKDREERYQEDIERSQQLQEEVRGQLQDLQGQESTLALTIQGLEEALTQKRSELGSKREELSQLRATIEGRGDDIARIQKEISDLESEISHLDGEEREHLMEISRIQVRLEELEFQMAALEESHRSAEFELGDAEWNLKEMRSGEGSSGKRLQELSVLFHEKRREHQEREAEAQDLEQAIRRLGRELESLKAQKSAAENLEKGYNRAVSSILQLRDEGRIDGIHGTVAELAEVDKDYETALNVAAGGRMQAVVVDDDEVASQAIEHLKRNRLGRVTFLPLSKMRDGRPRAKAIMIEKDCIGYAIDLIRFKPQYRAAFWHVLSDTLVVESLGQARSLMGGVRLVTMAGEVLETSGAMVGGTLDRGNIRFGAASEDKLEATRVELSKATQAESDLRLILRDLAQEMKGLEDEIRSLQGSNSDTQAELRRLELQRDSWKEKRDGLKAEIKQKRGALESTRKEESRIQGLLRTVQEDIKHQRQSLDGKRKEMSDLAPGDVQDSLQRLQDDIIALSTEVGDLEGDVKGLRAERAGLNARLAELQEDMDQSQSDLETWQRGLEESREKHAEHQVHLEALKKIEASMEGEVRELRSKRDLAYQSKVGKEKEKEQIEDRINTKRDFRIGLQTKASLAEERAEQIRQEIALIDMDVERPLPSMEELKRTIKGAENKMSQMGAVNLRAIEDYDTKKERHGRFLGEISRLEQQKAELLELMQSLEREKEIIFRQVFQAVDANFRNIYAELSGGGEAYLSLEDEDAPFEGGMLIKAKPKNGKMLRLEALSGGEKSLTALAFIFAIQEYQPSPFYVLDEVDMFLDSVNAEMVARRVQKSASKAQFVQVSLRKVTLGKAEHLFGVTRQPNGVSKVIIQPDMAAIGGYESGPPVELKT